ncbi:PREDICTED: telomere-associated protein RIF1 isoform X2 [Gavialis gangeticus]|uniref:telomere-associated protein RIF1 isoform X2 n=1 Tax=Gavialis gangeticus TaxID=94835 RepID=UPI00092F1C8F|nr:PREDICTED: telomere-associated protein RIF1 isoform X2 [Gavialis gangeticus]
MSAPGPGPGPSLLPLLETLEDAAAPAGELTDALLTFVNRLTGEAGKEFTADVRKHFPRLCKIFKAHISSENSELCSSALQALGFCVFNSKITSELSATEMQELLSTVSSIALKTSDKNTRTRALWVISKQTFPSEIVGKEVPSIISTVEMILTKGDVHSMVVEYEALNVIIRLMEQAPTQMGEEAVRWAKLIIPLVVHSAHKVQLRGAAALEMGMPLLLQKQQEVAAITEHLMSTKLISELQKLFSTKNETYVLKLWPLFVKLLGKTLHRSGSFINSLLQLEELGFRSGSPVVKKIAFIAWKSLIDNFALNPDILCSAKRLKLLMQPLSSIHVRTEALALTKLEVWWYLLVRLGPQLPANFEQVCVPLIQSTLSPDSSAILQGTLSRVSANQSLATATPTQKSGSYSFGSPGTPRLNFSSSIAGMLVIPSIQLLGIEMLLHFLMGPDVLTFAQQSKLVLSLEPLQYPLISSPSFFCKHASTLINAVQDGFIAIGKEVPDAMLNVVWKDMISYVKVAIESGHKKERQGSEVLTILLQALKNIVESSALPVQKTLSLIEITIKELPPKVLGSPAYQVADMDLLNGTPALFLIQLPFRTNLLEWCVTEERFFTNLEILVSYVLSGPTSPLAFSESVFSIINESAKQVENKEHLWRMWSIVVNPLTERINKSNEVNQGDALEHNFNAVYNALLLPISHIFPVQEFPQPTVKSLLRTWSDLYRVFARCASLVATAEENLCCEELCAKIIAGLEHKDIDSFSMVDGLTHIISVMVDCINFAPYGTKYQPKNRSPQTPTDWSKKKREPLGKLASLFKLLVMLINSFHVLSSKEINSESLISVGSSIIAVLHNVISHVSLPSVIRTMFATLSKPLAVFYEKTKLTDVPKGYSGLSHKLEKLLAEIILCLQSHYTGPYDSQLLQQLSPLLHVVFLHKSKQIRNQSAQFWNATFAKATALTYPEELKSILSQAKQKILLLLPGFESVEIVEESSGPFSDMTENSQWDAKISGIEVKLGGKRDSLLAQASEQKDKMTNVHITPAKLKLEFSSSKPKSDILLEEEKSADFVFIPPETKERILTEHQKEVLKTKRIDIPAMYNNLDASQDTTLFSQYSQSQEDSLGKTPLIDIPKEENEKKLQDENMKSDVYNCETHTPPETGQLSNAVERAAFVNTENKSITQVKENSDSKCEEDFEKGTTDAVLKELSAEDDSKKCTSEIVSKEPSVGDENVSNTSSSSSSSDIISGTPQPARRRQSFITLEKFDSSENRPFSPSALNRLSGASGIIDMPDKQETIDIPKTPTKAEEPEEKEDRSTSEPETEGTVTATKKLSRRQNKTELSDNRQSKFLTRSEEESGIQELAVALHMENKSELSTQVEEMECIPDTQSHTPSSTVVESIAVENKLIVDGGEEVGKGKGSNLDCKENTPPEVAVSTDSVNKDDNQIPHVAANQKALRRSLRRRSEIAEATAGNQDKENSHQKNKRKEDDKPVQKKVPQVKEDSSQKQKLISEKGVDAQIKVNKKENNLNEKTAEDDVGSKESCTSAGLEEMNKSIRKLEGNLKSEMDHQDSGSDIMGQKRSRPRYQTRRASQGLLSSIENSESDSSETREESAKKKKTGKWKNKSDSVENKGKEEKTESQNQEFSLQENVSEIRNLPDIKIKGETNPDLPVDEITGITDLAKASLGQNTDVEQNETSELTKALISSGTSEPVLKTRQENKSSDKQRNVEDCNVSVLGRSEAGTNNSDAALSSEKPLQIPDCQHKRSKRLRRSRSCDCCGEKSQQQEKSFTELKTTNINAVSETKKTPMQTTVSTSEVLLNRSDFDANSSVGPCATSTPLLLTKQSSTFDSETGLKSESDLQGTASPVKGGDAENLPCIMSELCDSITETQEAAVQAGRPEECLTESVSKEPKEERCLASENESKEPVCTEKKDIGENTQPEQLPDTETVSNWFEETKTNEPENVQNTTERNQNICVKTNSPQGSEMKEEGLIISEAEVASTVPEKVTSDQEGGEGSDNMDSPQKMKNLDSLTLVKVNESPNGVQTRCTWSPSASPSTSILKRGLKRQQEDDSPSPANKIRRVSFANPIYQEELADDIDRRSPVVRSFSSSNSSPSSRSLKTSSNNQTKRITTPTKGFLSPGSRNLKFKSSKKCLITEMAKELPSCPSECVYPALVGCKAPVDIILPQITSNIWARGLGQLIRAKNIKTVGDLSSLTASEIKTLPIRSPKVSSVKKALRGYHEQQVKARGFEEIVALEDAEKPVSVMEEKAFSTEEERLATDLVEPAVLNTDVQLRADLLTQISALAAQVTPDQLHSYSGSQLFEMQEKLGNMTNCIMKNLQSRWQSPPHEISD